MAGYNFRGHITFLGSFEFVGKQGGLIDLEVRGKSKITDFEGDLVLFVLVDKNVLELDIAMSEGVGVEIGDCRGNLAKELFFERVRELACL